MTDNVEKTLSPRTAVTRLTGSTSQCMGCGEVFNSTYAFDKHRATRIGRRVCLDPADCELVVGERTTGTVWKSPAKNAFRRFIQRAA